MKKIITVCILSMLVTLNLSAQKPKFIKNLSSRTVGIPNTSVMVDQYEVSLSEWFAFVFDEYYSDENREVTDGFNSVMPDTTKMPAKYMPAIRMFRRLEEQDHLDKYQMVVFKGYTSREKFEIPLLTEENKYGKTNEPFDSLPALGRLERLLDLPVVGITHSQAKLYLGWREKLANAYPELVKAKYKVKARFIKREEMTAWANELGPRFKTNNTAHIDTMNALGCYLVNVIVRQSCPSYETGVKLYGPGIVPVWAYNPDRLGLHNIFGNAWEMTNEEGTAIGGGWNVYGNQCDATITTAYAGAEPWLGFRCVFDLSR
jgi:formylglycine-generating enzyme required for sulfatase activity